MNNIRRIYMISLLFICSIVLTGCYSHEIKTTVHKNGKVDISTIYVEGTQNDTTDNKSIFEELYVIMESKGWERNPYGENDYVGYEMTKREIDLLDIDDAFDEYNDAICYLYKFDIPTDIYKVDIQKDGLNYIFELRMPAFEDEFTDEKEDNGKTYFTLELPHKPSYSNATSVSRDGKTLKWGLRDIAKNGIYVEFSLLYISPIFVCMAFGCYFLIAVVVAIFLFNKNHKKQEFNEM